MAPINVDNDTKNWLKVVLALKQLKVPLIPLVNQHVTALHNAIITKYGQCTRCTTENVLKCPTDGVCKLDRNKICKFHRSRKSIRCPNNICQNVRDEIDKNHVLRNPTWRNTDSTAWSNDPWEIAKCFLPPGSAGVHSAADTDCTGVLSLCLHIRPLQQALTVPGLSLVEKNRQNRNAVIHSGTQTLTDTERAGYIQDAISLLKAFQTPVNPDTQQCIDTLIKLDTDGFQPSTQDCVDAMNETLDPIKHKQSQLELEVKTAGADEATNRAAIETLQNSKVDQQTYMDTITTLDGALKTMNSNLNKLDDDYKDAKDQVTKIKVEMEEIRQRNENMKEVISGRIDILENEMKQMKIKTDRIDKRLDAQDELLNAAVDEQHSEIKSIRDEVSTINSNQQQKFTLLYSRTSDLTKQTQDQGIQLEALGSKVTGTHSEHGERLIHLDTRTSTMEKQIEDQTIQIETVQSTVAKIEKVTESNRRQDQVIANKGPLGTEDREAQTRNNDRKRLRDHLVSVYKKTCSKMPVAPPKRNMLADIKDHYHEQAMRQVEMPHEPKRDQSNTANKGEKRTPEEDQADCKLIDVNSYQDIFHRKGKPCQNIYIKGDAGSGKSVFCQNMTSKWFCINSPSCQACKSDPQSRSTDETNGPSDVQLRSSCEENDDHNDGQPTLNYEGVCLKDAQQIISCEDDGLVEEVESASRSEEDGTWDTLSTSSSDSDQCIGEKIEETNTLLLQNYEFLFYIELRYATEHKDIVSMIKDILLMGNDDLAGVLVDVLKNEPENCLVILDGLDEWAPPKGSTPSPHVTRGLPGRNITTNWTVLTTTRPWKLELVRPESEEMDQLIELSGLTVDSADECIVSVVEYLNDRFDENKSAGICYSALSTYELQHFMTLPVLLKQLVCIWFDEGRVGNSQCDIYAGMIDVYLRYSAQRHDNPDSLSHAPSDSLPSCLNKRGTCKKYTCELHSLSKLAFHTLFCEDRESTLVFNNTATEMHGMSEAETDMWLTVGLLSQDIADRGSATDHKQLSFPHKSIQEFLAAVYISVCDDVNTTKRISDSCTSVEMVMEMSQVFVFVAGMKPSTFTNISEHIAEVVNLDRQFEEYRTSTEHIEYQAVHIDPIQELVLKCITESKVNHHDNIPIHIHDIILRSNDLNNVTGVLESQLDLIRMNKADMLSLTLFEDRVRSGISQTCNFKEIGNTSTERFGKLRTMHVRNADIATVTYVLERNQNTLETISIKYQDIYEYSNVKDLTKANISVFSHFTHLHAIGVSGIRLTYHQIKQILSLSQNIELEEIVMSYLKCSPCIDRCVNCCENPLDMSHNVRLQRLKLDNLTFHEQDSVLIKVNTVQLQDCAIEGDYLSRPWHKRSSSVYAIRRELDSYCAKASIYGCITMKFTGTADNLRYITLSCVYLNHDQFAGLMALLARATGLEQINLSDVKCVDHGDACECQIDLTTHTALRKLELTRVQGNALQGTTINTSPNLHILDRKNVRLSNVHLNILQIDTDALNVDSSYITELTVHSSRMETCTINDVSTKYSASRFQNTALSTFQFIGTAERLQYLNLCNIPLTCDQLQELMSFVSRATCLSKIHLSSLRYVDHGDTSNYRLDLTKHANVEELHLNKLRITELKVNTKQLRKCTINDVCSNDSKSRPHDSALSAFEFTGFAKYLESLNIKNISLKRDQLQGLVSFVSRATLLREITLAALKCVDHDDACESQLELVERDYVQKLSLSSLHLNILEVRPMKQSEAQDEEVYNRFRWYGNFCVDITELHANVVQINTKILKIDKSHVNELNVITSGLNDWNLYGNTIEYTVDSVALHANAVHIKTERLKIDKSYVNELKVDTTTLQKCTITDVSSNESASGHHDTALSTLEFTGSPQFLKSMNISNIALTHDQLQGLISLLSRATLLWEITLSDLKCVDHDDTCESHLELVGRAFVWKISLSSLHLNILEVRHMKQSEEQDEKMYDWFHWYCNYCVDIIELHANVVHIDTKILKVDRSHVNELKVITSKLNDGWNLYGNTSEYTVYIVELHANVVHIKTEILKIDKSYVNELKVDTTRMQKCTITDVSANNSDSGHQDTSLSTFEFTGTAEYLKSLNVKNIALKHDQLQGLMSFMSRATGLREITLSELRCVDHGDICDYQLDLTELTKLTKLHLNTLQINELEVNTNALEACAIGWNDSEALSHDSSLSTLQVIGAVKHLQYLELRNINLTHDHFEEIMLFVTRTTCLRKIILSELTCADHESHGNMRGCLLTLRNHKELRKLQIDNVPVDEVEVNTTQLKNCRLTNLRTSAISFCPVSGNTNVHTDKCCGQLVFGNIQIKHEQLDGLVTFVTQHKDRYRISLYEIACSECDKECSWVVKLQQLVQFGQPDDVEEEEEEEEEDEEHL